MVSSNPLKACADLSECSGGQRTVSGFGSVAPRVNHLTNCVRDINRPTEKIVYVTLTLSVLLGLRVCLRRADFLMAFTVFIYHTYSGHGLHVSEAALVAYYHCCWVIHRCQSEVSSIIHNPLSQCCKRKNMFRTQWRSSLTRVHSSFNRVKLSAILVRKTSCRLNKTATTTAKSN